jgi:TonB family protein
MTGSFPRSPTAASPWGLLLSVSLHGLAFLAIIILSFSVSKVTKPAEETVSRVTLVEAKEKAPVAEQIQANPTQAASMLPEVITQPELPEKMAENPRATLEARAVAPQSRDVIRIKKRKKPARRVEAAKQPDKKKPQTETAKKKEDPQSYLKKRLEALRQEVEKKTDAAPAKPSRGSNQIPGRLDAKQGGASGDEDSARWFNEVRTGINSHWSVLGEDRQFEGVTIVGVRIGDDGRLIDASIDESSRDQVFDRSALRAVVQAAPFPPIPPELKEKISKAGGLAFRFTPKGMQ